MIKSIGTVGLTLLVVVSSFAGCSKAIMAGRPERSIERSEIIAAVQDKFKIADEIALYYDEPDPKERRVIRDRVLDWSIVLINEHFGEFIEQFSSGKKALDSSADIASIGADLGATLVGSAATKAILAAISAGITSSKASIDKNYFYEQSVKVLIKQMDSSRRAVYADILKGQGMTVHAYSFTAALGDLERYAFAGSFDGALAEIQQQAAEQKLDANKIISDEQVEREIVVATRDPQRLALIRSISTWLQEPESEKKRQERFDSLAKFIEETFKDKQTIALWLETASLANLQTIMDHFLIKTYTEEEVIEIGNRGKVTDLDVLEREIEEWKNKATEWIKANGKEAAAKVFNTWYENRSSKDRLSDDATILFIVGKHLTEPELASFTTEGGLFRTRDWIVQKATPKQIGQLFASNKIPLPVAPVDPTEAAVEWVRTNGNEAAAAVFNEWFNNLLGEVQARSGELILEYVSPRIDESEVANFTREDGSFGASAWITKGATPEQIVELFALLEIPLPPEQVDEAEDPSEVAVEWVQANGKDVAATVFNEWFKNLHGDVQTQFNSKILEYVGTRLSESDLQGLTDQDGLFLTPNWITQKATLEQIGEVFALNEIQLPPAPVAEPEEPEDTPTDDDGDGG